MLDLKPSLAIGLCLALAALPASAAEMPLSVDGRQDAPPELADECLYPMRHVPGADVAFRPGLDVHGRPVAPADLNAPLSPGELKESFAFDLTINPIAEAGLSFPTPAGTERFEDTRASVGAVEVDPASGAVAFEGQPIASEPGCLRP